MKIETKQLSDLIPSDYNPRELSDDAYDGLKASIEKFGLVEPIIFNEQTGNIVGGHQRYKVLQNQGVEETDVVIVSLSETDERALNITLNNPNIQGEFTDDLQSILSELHEEIPEEFEEIKLDSLFDETSPAFNTTEVIQDEVPEEADPVCKIGDIWELGEHLLLCGDSTNEYDVKELMEDQKADMVFTSPPYNVGVMSFQGGKDKYKGNTDNRTTDDYLDFLCNFTKNCLTVSDYVFVNVQWVSGARLALAKYLGLFSDNLKEVFCWKKNTAPPNIQKGRFTNIFENIFCFSNENNGKAFNVEWQGKHNNFIEGGTAASENKNHEVHSATFPSYLPLWFLERLDCFKSVFDPFMGTGTTLVVCEQLKRKCFGIEIDPQYCDIIIERWQNLTNQKAKHRRNINVTR